MYVCIFYSGSKFHLYLKSPMNEIFFFCLSTQSSLGKQIFFPTIQHTVCSSFLVCNVHVLNYLAHFLMCVFSVIFMFVYGLVSFLDCCSVPSHVPQMVTVHSAVAQIPSPTLVSSTVLPYRYIVCVCMATVKCSPTVSVRLTRQWLLLFDIIVWWSLLFPACRGWHSH